VRETPKDRQYLRQKMRWKDYEKGWWSKLEGKTVPQRGTNACPLMSAIL